MLDPSRPGSKQGALPWRTGVSQESSEPPLPTSTLRAASRRSKWTVEGAYGDWELVGALALLLGRQEGGGGMITWLPLLLSGPFTGP